jgi:hypothetical protein
MASKMASLNSVYSRNDLRSKNMSAKYRNAPIYAWGAAMA